MLGVLPLWLAASSVHIICSGPNDLVTLIQELDPAGTYACLNETLDSVVNSAQPNESVVSLSPGYPTEATAVSDETIASIASKNLKVYVEYPQGVIATSVLQRAVVADDGLFSSIGKMTILNPHAVPFVDVSGSVQVTKTYLHFAKVAGYDTATYGLPKKGVVPFLFEGKGSILYASTQISSFRTQRYAPTAAWNDVLAVILQHIGISQALPGALRWVPDVRPAYNATATLPQDAAFSAVETGVQWYVTSGMLPDAPRLYQSIPVKAGSGRMYFPPFAGNATGRMGVFEGHASTIDLKGNQPTGIAQRDDCITETAMSFAVLSAVRAKSGAAQGAAPTLARNILDYAWVHGGMSQSWQPGILGNPNGDFFGLLEWSAGNNVSAGEFYKDDDARALLAGIATSSFLPGGDSRWDSTLALGILANLRITGTNGFGPPNDYFANIAAKGWRSYYNAEWPPQFSPHYQAYLWAVYLWGFHVSGHQPLFDRAYSAIKIMMDGYPSKWVPTSNGITVQRARMVLPLAWLVRVTNSSESRSWLKTVTDGLMTRQHSCGAFQEEVSAASWGGSTRVPNNDNYGTFEAPLNQENTDPVGDMLYTQNFAMLGLNEAAAVMPEYAAAADKLADFLTRIQARSSVHPEFDGAYFRAFDFDKWEVWASDADLGWGAWSTETGWIQSWITSSIGMRALGTTLWDASTARPDIGNVKSAFDDWVPFLFPDS